MIVRGATSETTRLRNEIAQLTSKIGRLRNIDQQNAVLQLRLVKLEQENATLKEAVVILHRRQKEAENKTVRSAALLCELERRGANPTTNRTTTPPPSRTSSTVHRADQLSTLRGLTHKVAHRTVSPTVTPRRSGVDVAQQFLHQMDNEANHLSDILIEVVPTSSNGSKVSMMKNPIEEEFYFSPVASNSLDGGSPTATPAARSASPVPLPQRMEHVPPLSLSTMSIVAPPRPSASLKKNDVACRNQRQVVNAEEGSKDLFISDDDRMDVLVHGEERQCVGGVDVELSALTGAERSPPPSDPPPQEPCAPKGLRRTLSSSPFAYQQPQRRTLRSESPGGLSCTTTTVSARYQTPTGMSTARTSSSPRHPSNSPRRMSLNSNGSSSLVRSVGTGRSKPLPRTPRAEQFRDILMI